MLNILYFSVYVNVSWFLKIWAEIYKFSLIVSNFFLDLM